IDESTRASGTVIASSRVQVIQSVDGGVLEQLRVREGDRVRKGEVLAVFDETRTRASLQETEAKRTSQRATMARLEAELGGTEPQFAPELTKRFPAVVQVQDVSAELAKVREDYEQVAQQVTQKRQQLANSVVSSPASGIVKNVKFTTLGGVLRAGDELLQVVPVDDQMIVEAKVLPRDIALIRPGLKATLKFDAYDYTVFGIVDGEVTYVAADTMRD